MIELVTCKSQTRVDVPWLEIRHPFDNLLWGEPLSQEIQNVTYTNPHPTDARTPTTLLRVCRDAIH